jgi:hypothetical protein
MSKNLLLAVIILVLINFNSCSAFQIGYFSPANSAKITNIQQYSSVTEGGGLYSETLIEGVIENKTLANSLKYPSGIYFRALEGNRFFPMSNLNITFCGDSTGSWNGDYQKMYISCNKSIDFSQNLTDNALSIEFNLSEIEGYAFFIRINYLTDNFVMENGNYEIGWLKTEIDPSWEFERFLMLPSKDSVIESWNNFEIVARGYSNGKWVLKTKEGNDAMVWYRNYAKEKSDRDQRDWIIIVVSLTLSIIMQLYHHKKMSKRTINLWLFSGIFLAIAGVILLFGKGTSHPFLLGLSFILFLILSGLAYKSAIKDAGRISWRRQLTDVISFIKENFWKSLLIPIIALVLIIIFYLIF